MKFTFLIFHTRKDLTSAMLKSQIRPEIDSSCHMSLATAHSLLFSLHTLQNIQIISTLQSLVLANILSSCISQLRQFRRSRLRDALLCEYPHPPPHIISMRKIYSDISILRTATLGNRRRI